MYNTLQPNVNISSSPHGKASSICFSALLRSLNKESITFLHLNCLHKIRLTRLSCIESISAFKITVTFETVNWSNVRVMPTVTIKYKVDFLTTTFLVLQYTVNMDKSVMILCNQAV